MNANLYPVLDMVVLREKKKKVVVQMPLGPKRSEEE
jgi:hypothetical protein